MDDVNVGSDVESVWQRRREAQELKVVHWARQLLSEQGNELYRQVLITCLRSNPKGLDRLNKSEQERLIQIISRRLES